MGFFNSERQKSDFVFPPFSMTPVLENGRISLCGGQMGIHICGPADQPGCFCLAGKSWH
jgi:hypothetical protein